MPDALLASVLFQFTACAMEGVANLLHRYGMHGCLWFLHADHHHPQRRGLERNDDFAAFFALLCMGLIGGGVLGQMPYLVALGAGMAAYGVGYLLFHDVMFHRRIPGWRLRRRGAICSASCVPTRRTTATPAPTAAWPLGSCMRVWSTIRTAPEGCRCCMPARAAAGSGLPQGSYWVRLACDNVSACRQKGRHHSP